MTRCSVCFAIEDTLRHIDDTEDTIRQIPPEVLAEAKTKLLDVFGFAEMRKTQLAVLGAIHLKANAFLLKYGLLAKAWLY
jgi:2-methylcitrate dehydratase PrpD